MRDDTVSASFPLLSIARHYGVDYRDVLLVAEGKRTGCKSLAYVTAAGRLWVTLDLKNGPYGRLMELIDDCMKARRAA